MQTFKERAPHGMNRLMRLPCSSIADVQSVCSRVVNHPPRMSARSTITTGSACIHLKIPLYFETGNIEIIRVYNKPASLRLFGITCVQWRGNVISRGSRRRRLKCGKHTVSNKGEAENGTEDSRSKKQFLHRKKKNFYYS